MNWLKKYGSHMQCYSMHGGKTHGIRDSSSFVEFKDGVGAGLVRHADIAESAL